MSNLDRDELDDLLQRLARLEAKRAAHAAQLTRVESWPELYEAYLDGLADALAIMQGREPSRPDPVAR